MQLHFHTCFKSLYKWSTSPFLKYMNFHNLFSQTLLFYLQSFKTLRYWLWSLENMTYLDRNSLYIGLWSFTSFEKLRVLFIQYLNNNWWLVNNQMKIKDWVLYIEWDPGFSKRHMWRLRRLSNRSTRQIGCIRVSRIFGGFDCWVSRFKSCTKNCWNTRVRGRHLKSQGTILV